MSPIAGAESVEHVTQMPVDGGAAQVKLLGYSTVFVAPDQKTKDAMLGLLAMTTLAPSLDRAGQSLKASSGQSSIYDVSTGGDRANSANEFIRRAIRDDERRDAVVHEFQHELLVS